MSTTAQTTPGHSQQLCASCDRCRARKTKCDGGRPCGNCVTRHRKVNKGDIPEVLDMACYDCVYSPAKRRGPIPGRSSQSRAAAAASSRAAAAAKQTQFHVMNPNQASPTMMAMAPNLNDNGLFSMGIGGMSGVGGGGVQLQQQQQLGNMGNPMMANTLNVVNNGQGNNINGSNTFSADELKQMLALQQQLLVQQQQMQAQQQQQGVFAQLASMTNQGGGGNDSASLQHAVNNTLAVGNLVGNNTNTSSNGTTANSSNVGSPSPVGGMGMMGTGGGHQYPGGVVVGSQFSNGTNGANTNGGFQTTFQAQMQPQVSTQPQFYQQQQQLLPNQMGGAVQNNQVALNNNNNNNDVIVNEQRSAKRANVEPVQSSNNITGIPNSIASFLPLLQLNNAEGTLLRSYFELSTNDVLNLPPIPTDEEYSERLASVGYVNSSLPTYDQSALHAARFSELALGALANNQVPLALELSNASVMCLRNCVEEPSHKSCMYDVARAYLLHGIFRSFRGDMVRYFKYRRVCMTHVLQLNTEPHVESLLAAISFHDAWAYLMHNATEAALPDIDESLPRLNNNGNGNTNGSSNDNAEIKAKYGCCTNPSSVASDPINQMWMQGSPPVFLNNEACPVSRSLDAFACAVRSCCDQANHQFDDMAKAAGIDPVISSDGQQGQMAGMTPTTTAVMANENELCGRNIVLSAKSLLDQHWGMSNGRIKKHGLTMIAAAMSAFLENGNPEMENGSEGDSNGSGNSQGGMGGFTDGQIKNLLLACDIIIQHPLLLHSPGPLYHMSSNAAILLCHLMNGIHANCGTRENDDVNGSFSGPNGSSNKVESILFDEVLDTFMAMRKVLNIHRKSLPVKLRCHGIPRPNGIGPFRKSPDPDAAFIDLGETLMCLCRGCQGFVLMGCSPCVAAERSMKAAQRDEIEEDDNDTNDQQQWQDADNEFERQIGNMDDFNLDDDQLLDVLSRIVQN